jgi:Diacylglycerol kinase catalytic domain
LVTIACRAWILQVVELPREKPERALELFADMPGLRLLIIGGDGTVGWVLSCLDALQVTVTGHCQAPGTVHTRLTI